MQDKVCTTEELVAGGDDIRIRQVSAEICDLFEELLDAFNITLPDEERTGDDGEARIYGETYGNLEDSVTAVLAELAYIIRKYPDKPINKETY